MIIITNACNYHQEYIIGVLLLSYACSGSPPNALHSSSYYSFSLVVPDNIESSSVGGQWYGFKIVGDNLDKNISRRHQRIDRKTRSFHFFNSFAVKDRIDLSSCPQCPNPFYSKPISQLPIDTLLPSVPDDEALIANLSTIASRVLVDEFSFFCDTFKDVVNHIQHDYYTEMSQKSETVSYCAYLIFNLHVFVLIDSTWSYF